MPTSSKRCSPEPALANRIVATLVGTAIPSYPWPGTALLQLLVLLPAFGLTYAVGVARVLGPALVLRRSIPYEMLCGDLPFSRGSLTDVILAQARGALPLTERDPEIPAALDRAVRRAIEMTPDERPATPHAFASDVLEALGAAT